MRMGFLDKAAFAIIEVAAYVIVLCDVARGILWLYAKYHR